MLHVLDSLGLGGAQRVVYNLVRYGRRDRFVPEVACLHGERAQLELWASLGVPCHVLSPRRSVPLCLFHAPRLLRAGHFDIVHTHLLASNLIAKPLAVLNGVPVRISHDHVCDDRRQRHPLLFSLERMAHRFSSHVIAVSPDTHRVLVEQMALPSARVSTIPNGVDLEHFAPRPSPERSAREAWGLPTDALVVCGVGRLAAVKDFSLFLRIAARLSPRHPRLRFLLVGTGPERPNLESECSTLGLKDRVTFTGLVSDMPRVYAASHILLMTSRHEGLPMTLLEAMAMKLPVVAPALQGITSIVSDGHEGALVASRNEEAYVHRVDALLRDEAERRRLAENAHKKVQQYSALRMAQRVEELYERCYSRSLQQRNPR